MSASLRAPHTASPEPGRTAATPSAGAAPGNDVSGSTGEAPVEALSDAPRFAVLALMHYRPRSLLWGLSRLVLGARGVGKHPGLRFVRVLGSGREGGFGLSPGLRYQGLMVFFDEAQQAQDFAARAPAIQQRLARSDESLVAVLCATSARGSWGGVPMQPGADANPHSPIAVLTRASIRPAQAATFWRHSPASEQDLARAEGCQLAIGLGEAPVLRQATFSLWDNAEAINAYARHGAHGHAARNAWREGWFSEWMFVRFRVLSLQGQWRGLKHG